MSWAQTHSLTAIVRGRPPRISESAGATGQLSTPSGSGRGAFDMYLIQAIEGLSCLSMFVWQDRHGDGNHSHGAAHFHLDPNHPESMNCCEAKPSRLLDEAEILQSLEVFLWNRMFLVILVFLTLLVGSFKHVSNIFYVQFVFQHIFHMGWLPPTLDMFLSFLGGNGLNYRTG